jgi:DedD protein
MDLPSFFKLKRKDPQPAGRGAGSRASDDPGPVQAARAQARRRLIGAVVLLGIGVVGFPMLFETQPRPLRNDVPIELAGRQASPGATVVPPRHPLSVTELPAAPQEPSGASAASAAAATDARPTARAGDTDTSDNAAAQPAAKLPTEPAARVAEKPTAKPADKAPEKLPEKAPEKTPDKAPDKPATKPADSPPDRTAERLAAAVERARLAEARQAESARAKALLEGRAEPRAAAASTVDTKPGRFVVQVGAYTDADTMQQVRSKVEKLGLKTYTQSIETGAGKRTRVRVGPFSTRDEAELASGKLKAAGLPGNVLVL